MSVRTLLFLDIAQNDTTPDMYKCEEYFDEHEMNITQGILGLSSGVFMDNMW